MEKLSRVVVTRWNNTYFTLSSSNKLLRREISENVGGEVMRDRISFPRSGGTGSEKLLTEFFPLISFPPLPNAVLPCHHSSVSTRACLSSPLPRKRHDHAPESGKKTIRKLHLLFPSSVEMAKRVAVTSSAEEPQMQARGLAANRTAGLVLWRRHFRAAASAVTRNGLLSCSLRRRAAPNHFFLVFCASARTLTITWTCFLILWWSVWSSCSYKLLENRAQRWLHDAMWGIIKLTPLIGSHFS